MKSIEIKINIAEHNGMFKTNIEFTPVSASHPPPPHTHTHRSGRLTLSVVQ